MKQIRNKTPHFVKKLGKRAVAAGNSGAGYGYQGIFANTGAFGAPLGGPALAGVMVTPQTALTFTAVYAAIRVLSEDIASLPLEVFQALPGGGRKKETNHPVSRLLTESPNGESTDFNWRETWVSHCLGWGNGLSEIERRKNGEPIKLHLLHPAETQILRNDAGELVYKLGNQKELEPYYCLHLAGLGFNGVQGYSPVALAREAIGLGKAAEIFGATFFGNGARPGGVLEHPGKLSPEAQQNLRASINEIHGGAENAFRLAILEEGMKWTQTTIPPEDAQFLATRAFQVIEIARIYRIPPHKLGDYSQSHLANVEAANLDYLMTTLRPWLIRIEKVINQKLLTEAERKSGFYVKHDMRALMRASVKDRAEWYKALWGMGVYSANKILENEDENPLSEDDGGNKRFVPVNMRTLDSDFQEPNGDGQTPTRKTRSKHTDEEIMALNAADKTFLKNMIPHHQNAVKMAEKVIKEGQDARVKELAKKIRDGQTKEIEEMKEWLTEAGESLKGSMKGM